MRPPKSRKLTSRTLLRGAICLTSLAAAGLVGAQPVAPNAPSAPVAPAAEAPPPINVAPPAPVAGPGLSEKEVEPASPPTDQVVEKTVETPTRRLRYDVAVLQALDKVTAESMRFEVAVNRPIRYKSLIFTVKACERSAPDEAIDDSVAYVTIDSQPRATPGKPSPPARQAYKGWMYASSPGLHPLEHPVYDAWLITCRAAAPAPGAVAPPAAAPVAPAPKPVISAAAAPPAGIAPAAKPPAAVPSVKAAPATPPAKAPPTPAPKAAAPAPAAPARPPAAPAPSNDPPI